jgi:hypothetical protein
MGGIYEVRNWDGFRWRDIYTKFHKGWFKYSQFDRGQTAWWSHKPTFIYFLIRKVTNKIICQVTWIFDHSVVDFGVLLFKSFTISMRHLYVVNGQTVKWEELGTEGREVVLIVFKLQTDMARSFVCWLLTSAQIRKCVPLVTSLCI